MEYIVAALIEIFFIVLGIFLYKQPELFWRITESWKSYDATEPSDSYVKSTRFGGIICIITGIVLIFIQIYLNIYE